MTVISTNCPTLNENNNSWNSGVSDLEVLVNVVDGVEGNVAVIQIICPEYSSGTKECSVRKYANEKYLKTHSDSDPKALKLPFKNLVCHYAKGFQSI
jgi:hypothetical protein